VLSDGLDEQMSLLGRIRLCCWLLAVRWLYGAAAVVVVGAVFFG
jgi:hypothetical protein